MTPYKINTSFSYCGDHCLGVASTSDKSVLDAFFMASSLPRARKAVVTTGRGAVSVQAVEIPRPRSDELIVRTVAVGLNPTDWKSLELAPAVGAIIGVDFSGVVAEVGRDVTKFNVGDRVAGFVHGSVASNHEYGAFSEYVLAFEHLTTALPQRMSFDEGATIGVGITTVGQALGGCLRLPLPVPSPFLAREGVPGQFILIYGGQTSTGILAIQLAKLSGLRVIATCSSNGFDRVKSLGAEQAFDYVCLFCNMHGIEGLTRPAEE